MLTKEDVKNYFKDKIDWKFFNYLNYKLVTFEDLEFTAHMCIKYKSFLIYELYNDYSSYNEASEEFLKEMSDTFDEKKLYYDVYIVDESKRNKITRNRENIEKYIKSVESKLYGYNYTSTAFKVVFSKK